MADTALEDEGSFRIADALVAKPLAWAETSPAPSQTPVLSFVKFRAFDRALKGYRSIVQLLKAGQWEDAIALARSLYELNINLSAIVASPDPERGAKKFVRFGKLQRLRLEQRRLKDRHRDEKLKSPASARAITECEQGLSRIASTLNNDFADFRKPKSKGWLESWSESNVEALAQRLAKETGGLSGQSDYYVFALASLYAHNSPGAMFLPLPQDRETEDWKDFRAALDDAGRRGLRNFLYEASICLVDIVGMTGDSITGYEKEWFDQFAIPLLEQL